MIKIFTDKTFLTPEYRKIIFPLLFDLCYANTKSVLKIYQIVDSIVEADIVVVPVAIAYFFENNKKQWLHDFIEAGNNAHKPVWVYSGNDRGITLDANVYTFRLGGFHSKLHNKTFILPSFITDPLVILKKEGVAPIPKEKLPHIGFVGHAASSNLKWIKEYAVFLSFNLKRIGKHIFEDYQPFYPSSIKRHHLLMAMQKNDQIKTDFIYRDKYRAGTTTAAEKVKTTLEFFENIDNNPYVFCLRGAGNFSVRFYETLAMGRIPVIINTDIRLPLPEMINWKNHCIMATEHHFMDELINFHANSNEKDFAQMQINNRNLWLNYLNRDTYFHHVYSIFKEKFT